MFLAVFANFTAFLLLSLKYFKPIPSLKFICYEISGKVLNIIYYLKTDCSVHILDSLCHKIFSLLVHYLVQLVVSTKIIECLPA